MSLPCPALAQLVFKRTLSVPESQRDDVAVMARTPGISEAWLRTEWSSKLLGPGGETSQAVWGLGSNLTSGSSRVAASSIIGVSSGRRQDGEDQCSQVPPGPRPHFLTVGAAFVKSMSIFTKRTAQLVVTNRTVGAEGIGRAKPGRECRGDLEGSRPRAREEDEALAFIYTLAHHGRIHISLGPGIGTGPGASMAGGPPPPSYRENPVERLLLMVTTTQTYNQAAGCEGRFALSGRTGKASPSKARGRI
ncbi:hypothetical protein TREES_T100013845 [Tupaia chinensis]|uniref:Uncharacterized protein n=1 Tax=Tupaia chinensis TaxID=246437 RepID=L9KZ68_TUPCH|nr:hypothetical protein TREES_T100013845 [Tupaia chinensis]